MIGRLSPNVPLVKRGKSSDLRDKVEGVIRILTDFDNDNLNYPEVEKITRNDLTIADLSTPVNKFAEDNRVDYVKRFDVTVWQHDNYGVYIDGSENPTSEAHLQLNGQDRQSKRAGTWHDTVEPYMRHSNTSKDGINVFSFALNPEEHQPSSTCNMSRIDTAQLNLSHSKLSDNRYGDILADSGNKNLIFTINYNVLRCLSGMAGTAYSN